MTAARFLRSRGQGRFVLLRDHVSHHIPAELRHLGPSKSDFRRHIARDIGAAGITESLSEQLNSPAILRGVSRSSMDCNRQLKSLELIPALIHGTSVPGNATLRSDSRKTRIERWYEPYHDAVETVLLERLDEIATAAAQRRWALRFAEVLNACL